MIYTRRAKALILDFLQEAFSQHDLVDGQNPFLWSEDEEQSKILIADSYTENLQVVEKRPAIILSRGPITWMNIGLNQEVSRNMKTGDSRHQDLLKTSVSCNCFSRNGLQAEELATIVFSLIQFFSWEVLVRNGVFEVNSLSIGQESIVTSDSRIDLSVVPVEIGLYFKDTWSYKSPRDAAARHDSTGIRIHTPDYMIDRDLKT